MMRRSQRSQRPPTRFGDIAIEKKDNNDERIQKNSSSSDHRQHHRRSGPLKRKDHNQKTQSPLEEHRKKQGSPTKKAKRQQKQQQQQKQKLLSKANKDEQLQAETNDCHHLGLVRLDDPTERVIPLLKGSILGRTPKQQQQQQLPKQAQQPSNQKVELGITQDGEGKFVPRSVLRVTQNDQSFLEFHVFPLADGRKELTPYFRKAARYRHQDTGTSQRIIPGSNIRLRKGDLLTLQKNHVFRVVSYNPNSYQDYTTRRIFLSPLEPPFRPKQRTVFAENNGTDDRRRIHQDLTKPLPEQESSSPSFTAPTPRVSDMHMSLSNTYWKAVVASRSPHIGASIMGLLSETGKVPALPVCQEIVRLLTFGPKAQGDHAFYDGNRLTLVFGLVQRLLRKHPAIMGERFVQAAGPDHWKTVLDNLWTLPYPENPRESLQMHSFALSFLLELLQLPNDGTPGSSSPTTSNRGGLLLETTIAEYGGKAATKAVANALAFVWARHGRCLAAVVNHNHTTTAINNQKAGLQDVTLRLTRQLSSLLLGWMFPRFIPTTEERADVLWSAMDRQLQQEQGDSTIATSKAVTNEQLQLYWVCLFAKDDPPLCYELEKRVETAATPLPSPPSSPPPSPRSSQSSSTDHPPQKQRRRPRRLEDEATKARLLAVGDKVYAPYPGLTPSKEEYFWGEISKKHGNGSARRYDIAFHDGDHVEGLSVKWVYRMPEMLELMRQGHMSNDPPPKEYLR